MSNADTGALPSGWRLKSGVALLVLSLMLPIIASPLIAVADLEPATKAMLTGALWVGLPEVIALLAVLLLGKRGFDYLISKLLGRMKALLLVRRPGPVRHAIGVLMFVVPLLLTFIAPYLDAYLPGWLPQSIYVAWVGHLIFVLSFFVLGGEFWEKVRALFLRSEPPQPPAAVEAEHPVQPHA